MKEKGNSESSKLKLPIDTIIYMVLFYIMLYLFIIYINTKIHSHTSHILHTDYIHDKYNIDYVKYKHTHKLKYHLHCNT